MHMFKASALVGKIFLLILAQGLCKCTYRVGEKRMRPHPSCEASALDTSAHPHISTHTRTHAQIFICLCISVFCAEKKRPKINPGQWLFDSHSTTLRSAGVYDTEFTLGNIRTRYTGLMEYFAENAAPVIRKVYPSCSNVSTSFEAVPFVYQDDFPYKTTLEDVEKGVYDFVFMPSNLAVCTASFGWTHLVTRVKSKSIQALSKSMIPVGGVVFTRAGNNNIRTFDDLRNKIVVSTW
jgi:hypothetical protein